jgi:hypothetical protein
MAKQQRNVMIQIVIALCLFNASGELIEHTYKNNLSDCLKSKREMNRNMEGSLSSTMCGEVEAIIQIDESGSEPKTRIIQIIEKG